MRSTSWLTDSRREMAVELHRELLEQGVSQVRRRLKSAPVVAPSLLDSGNWDEETPVDIGLDEETEPEALWRALAELEAEPADRLPEPPRGPQARRRTPSSPHGIAVAGAAVASPWPSTEWGMPDHSTEADKPSAKARAARRLAHGTADPTPQPQRAFDVLVTARRASHVVIARRELPAKATTRPTVLSAWNMPAQRSRRWHVFKLAAIWTIGLAIVCAGLIAAGMAMP